MSKRINFNARDFKFDENCQSNTGSRMFVSDENGSYEVFDIGDWRWSWTNIKCQMKLEKNTDYVFTFEVQMGMNDTNDAVSRFNIYFDENWDDRYCYPMENSIYKPVISKKCGGGLVRVYEIPFSTGDSEVTNFLFSAQHAITRLVPARDLSAYENMEDMTYQQWWEEKCKGFNSDSFDFDDNSGTRDGMNINLQGANISSTVLEKLMKKLGDGCNVDLGGANIFNDGHSDDVSSGDTDSTDDIPNFAKKSDLIGLKASGEAIREQYENCPDDSVQKGALKAALENIEEQMKNFES